MLQGGNTKKISYLLFQTSVSQRKTLRGLQK